MTDITELAQRNELLIANGQQTADLLRHLADNEIDSDYFAVVSECESYGKETDAELSITEFAIRAAGYVDALVEALEKAQAKIIELQHGYEIDPRTHEIIDMQERIAELESRTVTAAAADVLAERQRQVTAEGWTAEREEMGDVLLYRHAQPAPVVPELMVDWQENEFSAGWNACRAAMMQELKKSAGTEAICRSDENVQVLHTKSPAQSDCCPAQNVVVPAQSPIDHGYLPECECSGCKATARICTEMAVNSLVIPNEMTSEQAYEIGYYYGDPVNVFARGANWMRQHIIDSTLAAAPQLPGSEPATVPGKWIPVSERMPEVGVKVLCFPAEDEPIHAVFNGQLWLQDISWSNSDEPIDNVITCNVTHWVPLPASPQEVK